MEILVIDECELNSHSEPFFKLIFASILFFFLLRCWDQALSHTLSLQASSFNSCSDNFKRQRTNFCSHKDAFLVFTLNRSQGPKRFLK